MLSYRATAGRLLFGENGALAICIQMFLESRVCQKSYDPPYVNVSPPTTFSHQPHWIFYYPLCLYCWQLTNQAYGVSGSMLAQLSMCYFHSSNITVYGTTITTAAGKNIHMARENICTAGGENFIYGGWKDYTYSRCKELYIQQVERIILTASEKNYT